MTNKIMRYARSAALPVLALGSSIFALSSCEKKNDPDPIIKTGVNESRVEHVYDIGMNIKVNDESTNYFMPESIIRTDGTIASGLNASVTGQDASRVATGASTADMIKFTMKYDLGNIGFKDNRLIAVNPAIPVIKYSAAGDGELKDIVVIETSTKADGGILTLEKHYHPKEASILAPSQGVKILGKTFTNDTFKQFIKNSAENTEVFTKFNVMTLEKPTKITADSFYKLEK